MRANKNGGGERSFWHQTQGPGRMAQTPRAGTGDSACKSWHYHQWWSPKSNQGNLSMCGTSLIRLLLLSDIHVFFQPQKIPSPPQWRRSQITCHQRRCKTSFVGQGAGLSVPRLPVRFLQKTQKSRTQIYIWGHKASSKPTRLFLTTRQSNNSNINQSDRVDKRAKVWRQDCREIVATDRRGCG